MLVDSGSSEAVMTYLPVLYLEADSQSGDLRRSFYQMDRPRLFVNTKSTWGNCSRAERNCRGYQSEENSRTQVERFLMPMIDGVHSDSRERDVRVRRSMMQLWKTNSPQML